MSLLIALLFISLLFIVFVKQPQFGATPKGKRLERIQQSKQYRKGSFQNNSHTPVMAEGVSMLSVLKEYLKKHPNREPNSPIPHQLNPLVKQNTTEPTVVWFGHSSYLINITGKYLLIDPVFSGSASPIGLVGKNYPGSNPYAVKDLPNIDWIILTHDHYDHLDYKTIIQFKNKTTCFITSLGVGAHLAKWGFDESRITELDWKEKIQLGDLKITAEAARHFSGRLFKRGETLWSSFILESTGHKLYLGGDSGYDDHFKRIGQEYGPFDLAILECGQYNPNWKHIHMMPEETAQAALDLNAKYLLPVHWAKFSLSLHAWTDPIERVSRAAKSKGLPITTPMIGEPILIDKYYPQQTWWEHYS